MVCGQGGGHVSSDLCLAPFWVATAYGSILSSCCCHFSLKGGILGGRLDPGDHFNSLQAAGVWKPVNPGLTSPTTSPGPRSRACCQHLPEGCVLMSLLRGPAWRGGSWGPTAQPQK